MRFIGVASCLGNVYAVDSYTLYVFTAVDGSLRMTRSIGGDVGFSVTLTGVACAPNNGILAIFGTTSSQGSPFTGFLVDYTTVDFKMDRKLVLGGYTNVTAAVYDRDANLFFTGYTEQNYGYYRQAFVGHFPYSLLTTLGTNAFNTPLTIGVSADSSVLALSGTSYIRNTGQTIGFALSLGIPFYIPSSTFTCNSPSSSGTTPSSYSGTTSSGNTGGESYNYSYSYYNGGSSNTYKDYNYNYTSHYSGGGSSGGSSNSANDNLAVLLASLVPILMLVSV